MVQLFVRELMFCWTHFINNTSEDNYSDSKYNDLVKKYETHLEGSSSGHSDYDECNPGDFENSIANPWMKANLV